jgi:hypothetical protein
VQTRVYTHAAALADGLCKDWRVGCTETLMGSIEEDGYCK